MYDVFLARTAIRPHETLLDVGVTSDQTYDSSNYVEAWYPHKDKITAVGIDDASFLERQYPGLSYRRADGRNLPFQDASFDVVHSSAVLEHVGSAENQRGFIAELTRVASRAVFFTTPNRWFPVEFHSVLPLVHWLPRPWFRRLLRNTRYEFFAREENLNLVDRKDIARLCNSLQGCVVSVESLRLLGMPSNLLVTIRKRATANA
jgi:ubiquinone/menaquinone biosynthesis C-methylase UbiE